MTEALQQLEQILTETGQPANPLRHHQVETYTQEAKRLGGIIRQQDVDGRPGQAWIGGDAALAHRRVRAINKILVEQAPKRLTGDRVNRAHALATQVIQDTIRPAMLPRSVMRRNPAGAVGAFRRTEASAGFKRAALAVKRAIRAIDPENPDPDLTNLERFRPEGSPLDGTSSFMADATIPGFLAMSTAAKANWPLGEPTVATALQQVARREARESNGHTKKTKAVRAKRPATPAQLAALARAQAALRVKRAAAAQGPALIAAEG